MSELTNEEREALKIAEKLIDAGIPIFAAAPNPDKPGEYYLPKQWEKTVPSRVWLEKWRPGWALGAVGGHTADFLDADPRNGGDQSLKELEIQGQMPRSFGRQRTPSGGIHDIISPTGERKISPMPGLDLQSGDEAGVGRGFVYIAPTVRPSKAPETVGQLFAYRWEVEPDLDYLAEFGPGTDESLEGLLARVHAKRGSKDEARPRESAPGAASSLFAGIAGQHAGPRAFTMEEAFTFCAPTVEELERAPIGEIEERANVVAATLSHFVPSHWTADYAYAVLLAALSKTAYDPTHPASGWTAEKFRPVLDGRRPPLDDWKAELRITHEQAASEPVEVDEVDALIGEMLNADQLQDRPAPKYLIKGLLNLDSEAWTIGEPGCKKSFVVLDQAIHVVKGMPWRGLKVNQGPVVMIAAEGAAGMSTRVKAWQQTYGPIGQGFHMLPRPVQASNARAWRVLAEACRRLGAVMVVIDTQARVTVGLKENDATDMGIYVEAVRIIREATGACVNTIHHTGRNGGDARGSSAIDGAQGTELKVIKKGPYDGVLKVEKQKDMEEIPDIPLAFTRVVVGQDEDGDDISSLILTDSNAFMRAEGVAAPEDPAGSVRVSEPEEWTYRLEPGQSGEAVIRRQLLQTIHDLAGTSGLKESDLRRSMTERWYSERGATSRTKKGIDEQTWNRTVTIIRGLEVDGEKVVVSGETAAKLIINQMVTGQ